MEGQNKGIYFTKLRLQNVRCFGDEAVLKLCNENGDWQRWNIILGDNGIGKTTLLQCLAALEINIIADLNEYPFRSGLFPYIKDSLARIVENNKKNSEINLLYKLCDNNPSQYSEIEFPPKHKLHSSFVSWKKDYNLFVLGYGANRLMSSKVLNSKNAYPEISETLFDVDGKILNTKNWFMQRSYYLRKYGDSSAVEENNKKIFDLLQNILPEIDLIRLINTDFYEKNTSPIIEFKTPFGWVEMDNLSFGFKSMVAWILDVFARMVEWYSDSENPLHEPVVILVDEIDLHLHPKWQRQIFTFLGERFPRAQFVVTAHSPLIVQSAPKDANIIVLKKEKVGEDYVVKIDNDVASVRNWRIDQIMSSDIFGLGSSRSPEIEKLLNERKDLILKGNLTQEEKLRLEELNIEVNKMPTAESEEDIVAMQLIREAAAYLKNKPKNV